MGNWISVYADAPERLKAVVGTKDQKKLDEIIAANPDIAKSEHRVAYLLRVINGEFDAGERPDGGRFVQAFEEMCQTYSPRKCTVEIYLDEEAFPQMWEFVWASEEVPFDLPLSESGSPAVRFWNTGQVKRFRDLFKALDFDTLRRTTGQSDGYREEIRELGEVLEAASQTGCGVHVFYSE